MGGGDIVVDSSRSPETRVPVEETFEGETLLKAEAELLDEGMALILLGMDASEGVEEAEPSFKLSTELVIFNEGS
jgi:hypothetical protein